MNAESLHIESIYPFSYVCARTLERKCIRSVSDKNYRWLWWKKGFSQIPKLITLSNFPNFMLPCLCRLVFPGLGHGETRRLIQNQTMSLAPTKWHTSSMRCQISGTDQNLPQVVFLSFRFKSKCIGQEEYWIEWSEEKEEKWIIHKWRLHWVEGEGGL